MPPLTPLLRPDRYFAERERDGNRVLVVLLVLTLAGPATLYGIGWIFTAHVDGTVTVDNPERPPDWVCERESPSDGLEREGCDQPREVERDVDSIIWSVIHDNAGPAFLAWPLAWFVTGIGLHAGSWMAGGERGSAPSFVVAAWGWAPTVLLPLLGLPLLSVALDPVTVGSGGSEAFDAIESQIRAIRPVADAIAVATIAWGAVIWRYGLEHRRGLDGPPAWGVAGVVAVLLAVVALV